MAKPMTKPKLQEPCPNCLHRAHYALRCGAVMYTGGEGEFDIPIRCECLNWGDTANTGEMGRANVERGE